MYAALASLLLLPLPFSRLACFFAASVAGTRTLPFASIASIASCCPVKFKQFAAQQHQAVIKSCFGFCFGQTHERRPIHPTTKQPTMHTGQRCHSNVVVLIDEAVGRLLGVQLANANANRAGAKAI